MKGPREITISGYRLEPAARFSPTTHSVRSHFHCSSHCSVLSGTDRHSIVVVYLWPYDSKSQPAHGYSAYAKVSLQKASDENVFRTPPYSPTDPESGSYAFRHILCPDLAYDTSASCDPGLHLCIESKRMWVTGAFLCLFFLRVVSYTHLTCRLLLDPFTQSGNSRMPVPD